jgi:hypothetical protein
MSDKYWRRNGHASRTAWEYCTDGRLTYDGERSAYVIGYIIKREKHRCRDWLVYAYPSPWDRRYLGLLTDLSTGQAKQTAQLLIGAQK